MKSEVKSQESRVLVFEQLTTNNQQPTTNNQQPTTNNQQPTTNHLPRITMLDSYGKIFFVTKLIEVDAG